MGKAEGGGSQAGEKPNPELRPGILEHGPPVEESRTGQKCWAPDHSVALTVAWAALSIGPGLKAEACSEGANSWRLSAGHAHCNWGLSYFWKLVWVVHLCAGWVPWVATAHSPWLGHLTVHQTCPGRSQSYKWPSLNQARGPSPLTYIHRSPRDPGPELDLRKRASRMLGRRSKS